MAKKTGQKPPTKTSFEKQQCRCTNCKAHLSGIPENSERGSLLKCEICGNQMPLWPSLSEKKVALPSIPSNKRWIWQRGVMSDRLLKKIMFAMELYSRKLPHISDTRFPSEINVVDASVFPMFGVTHTVLLESRHAKKMEPRLLKQGESPKSKGPAKTVDVWNLDANILTQVDDLLKERKKTSFKSEIELESAGGCIPCEKCKKGKVACSKCSGEGKHSCEICDGTRRYPCDQCEGKTWYDCSSCKGRGEIRERYSRNEYGTCKICKGKGVCLALVSLQGPGEQVCGRCHGRGACNQEVSYHRDLPCPECNTFGKLECHKCDADGQLDCWCCDSDGNVDCKTCTATGKVTCETCRGFEALFVSWVLTREITRVTDLIEYCESSISNDKENTMVIKENWVDYKNPVLLWSHKSSEVTDSKDQAFAALPEGLAKKVAGLIDNTNEDDNKKFLMNEVLVESIYVGKVDYSWNSEEQFSVSVCEGNSDIGLRPNPLTRRAEHRLQFAISQWGEQGPSSPQRKKEPDADKNKSDVLKRDKCIQLARISYDIAKHDQWFEKSVCSAIPPTLTSEARSLGRKVFAKSIKQRTVKGVGKFVGRLFRKSNESEE